MLCVVALALVASPAVSRAAPGGKLGYVTASWHTSDGLPSEKIHHLLQTQDGYLWIATRNGVARFDGVRFQIFNTTNSPALRSDLINRLCEDRTGTLWIGSETGELTTLVHGVFEPVDMPADWPAQPVERIVETGDGTIWVVNRSGRLLGLRNRQVVADLNPPDGRFQDVILDRDGVVWVANGGEVQRLDGTQVRWDESCPPRDLFRPRIAASPRGGIWIAEGGRLRRWQDGHWIETRTQTTIGTTIRALAETPQGDVLVGTFDQGLQIVAPDGVVTQIDRDHGLPGNWIQTILHDAEGNLWLGVGSNGLWRLRTRRVSMIDAPDQWLDGSVLCVTPRSAGGVWVGTEGAGLYQVDQGQAEHVGSFPGSRSTVIRTLLEDRQGTLWVGFSGANLATFNHDGFVPASKASELTRTFALKQTSDDSLWIGTRNGIATSRDATPPLDAYTFEDLQTSVRGIVETPDGTVWLGTLGQGVLQIKNGIWRGFNKTHGLPGDYIWSLSADDEGTVWAGTFGHGLVRIRDGKCLTLSTDHGLPGGVISHIQDDHTGHLWIASNHGIFRLAKDEIDQVAAGRRTHLSCLVLDTSDGLASLEMTGGSQPAGCRTADGRLWFATAGGLAVVDPAHITTNSRPPPVVIEEFRVKGRSLSSEAQAVTPLTQEPRDHPFRILPGATHLEIDYTALSFTTPQRVRFRYRLEGSDREWVEAGTRRTAYYSYLPPGRYTFRVSACNNDGLWNETGATLRFDLRPFFWQTGWFALLAIFLGAAVIAGAVALFARHRHRQRLLEWKRREAFSAERTRIARDIHDDLGAGLTQVMLLAHSAQRLLPDPAKAAERLTEIKKSVGEMTQAMDEIVWAVNPRCDSLDSLATYLGQFAQDFLRAGDVRCLLDLPLELPAQEISAEARHCLYLVLRETLNNILKHAGAKMVTITMELVEDSICLIVTDDGVGLNHHSAPSETTVPRTRSGFGMAGMRQRLQEAGGHLQAGPAPNGGTRVRLKIPLPSKA